MLEQTALIAHNAAFDMRTPQYGSTVYGRVIQACPYFGASGPNEMKRTLFRSKPSPGPKPRRALQRELSLLADCVFSSQAMSQSWDPSIVTPTASSEKRAAVIRAGLVAAFRCLCFVFVAGLHPGEDPEGDCQLHPGR